MSFVSSLFFTSLLATMSRFVFLTTTCMLAAIGVVSANPVTTRQSATCSPNFVDAGVCIIAGDMERPTVAQTGSSSPMYTVKAITKTGLAVDAANGFLTLESVKSTTTTQSWEIKCKQCFSGASCHPKGGEFAVGCAIVPPPSGLPVQLEMGSEFFGLNPRAPVVAQTFDFWTATA
ncbi:hypothetical protein B0H10DRAFT_2217917 [Mycena sp. CBHHK59/15]|nr:hypothetical protein B0H10DRAFT_2217917 [Mycena sp. CBHHK59/15]